MSYVFETNSREYFVSNFANNIWNKAICKVVCLLNALQVFQDGYLDLFQMMRLPGQMQHMNIAQNQFSSNQGNQMGFGSTRPQYQAGTLPANLGQAMMSNSYGPNRPTMPSQQPILVNSGYAAGSMATSPNMGHTLSNQLWK